MKRAIVLGGGGAKGAYQLGFWRALRECDITYDLALGTSIGALNAAMMATELYDTAQELWENIKVCDIMRDGVNFEYSIEAMFRQRAQLLKFLKRYVNSKGADTSPLRELVSRVIDEDAIRASKIKFGLVTLEVPSLTPHEVLADEIPKDKLDEFLMASCACFPAFPLEKIDGKVYIDGGYYDNLPIDFAIRAGADEIIAVDLAFDSPTHPKYTTVPNVTYISPSHSLGAFLNFSRDIILRNIELGYLDTMRAFKKFRGFRYAFYDRDIPDTSQFLLAVQEFEAKAELPSLTACVLHHTTGSISTSDWNIRGLEITAELLDASPTAVYSYTELTEELQRKVADTAPAVKPSKDIGGAPLIALLIQKLKAADAQELKWVAASMPKALCAAIFLSQ